MQFSETVCVAIHKDGNTCFQSKDVGYRWIDQLMDRYQTRDLIDKCYLSIARPE